MKKILFFLILHSSFIIHHSFSQSPNWLWAKAIGGTSKDASNSIAIDASGNVYTTGVFQGIVDFDPGAGTFNLTSAGGYDIFISKLNSSGNFIWAKAMGGTGDDGGGSIALDLLASGDICITGAFNGTVDFDPGAGTINLTSAGLYDIFISKLDNSGNFIWAKAMGGTVDDGGFRIALDPSGSGSIYTTGTFEGTADFDPGAGTFNLTAAGGSDIFISKLNSSGNFVWAKAMGGAYDDYSSSIAIDTAGNGDVYTTGAFNVIADFDPGPGTFNLTSAALEDIFISKLDNSGNFVWAKAMGGTGFDYGFSIAPDVSGNVHVAGEFQSPSITFGSTTLTNAGGGNYDAFIAKLDHLTEIESVESKNGIAVFPNPSSGEFTIDMNEMEKQVKYDISIYNLLGEKVYSSIFNLQLSILMLPTEFIFSTSKQKTILLLKN